MEIQESKKVWVAWTNTDLTEGRGYNIPFCVCDNQITAERLGMKKSVQGCDCHVTEEIAVKIEGKWLAPSKMHRASTEDEKAYEMRTKKVNALTKAKAAGLTDEEIKILS